MSEEIHTILVVDDIKDNVLMLSAHLKAKKYKILQAFNGVDAIKIAITELPDLILLDVKMPQMSGHDVCAQLKQHESTKLIPIILVTAHSETSEIVKGFEIGADDYLIKPYNYMEMLARVRSMLRIQDAQMQALEANRKLDELNQNLEEKVQLQVSELAKANRLRRFFSPQIVDSILSENADDILKEHRREITVVFLDLRNFTRFADSYSPQIVIQSIREFHAIVGPIIFKHQGTLERFTGDGLMVFLGDPEPMENHATEAIKMVEEIHESMLDLEAEWKEKEYNLELGIGLATGEASLGTIGFEGRYDYAAIGTVTNLAARLCGKAEGNQILISERCKELSDVANIREMGDFDLKGFSQAQKIYELIHS
ncbi:MAG: response regulator [Lentisphaeria bacterium]|nr:response regulator [Lentisphaeria bacterium]NQZ69576.1 response regulator [Lentisphaeria bacterium]